METRRVWQRRTLAKINKSKGTKRNMKKLVKQITRILDAGAEQVTLSRAQVLGLLEHAEKRAQKSRDKETQRLRLSMHRAEEELRAMSAAVLRLSAKLKGARK